MENTTNNQKSILNNRKLALVFSIVVTIIIFIVICTLIASSFIVMLSGAGNVEKRLALTFVIVSCLLIIPFGILFTISYLEIKIYKKQKKVMSIDEKNKEGK